jgi:hypothetical protein
MLSDLVFHHPEYLLLGIGAWIIAAVWTLTLFGRMITLEVDTVTGIIGIGLSMGMAYMTVEPAVPILQPISLAGLYLSGVMIPLMKIAYQRQEVKSVDIDGVEKAYEGFVLRPNNPAAKIRLARHLYNLGVRGHAMVLAEEALPDLPRRYFPDEHRMVEGWRRYPPAKSEFEPIACVECAYMNRAGTIHCARCGSRFLLYRVQGRIVSKALGRRLLAAWVVMGLALLGIPFAAGVGGIKGMIATIVISVSAVVTLVIAFRETEEPAA